MPKLPQHIEERFDKEFPFAIMDWKLGPENDGDMAAIDKMKQIKSFIATILEEAYEAIEVEMKPEVSDGNAGYNDALYLIEQKKSEFLNK